MDDALTRAELVAAGWSRHSIDDAMRRGTLVRIRRGFYALDDLSPAVRHAVRVGGRLSCVSELRDLGVWVHEPSEVHVQVAPNAARLRRVTGAVVHWHPLLAPPRSGSHVGVVDALVRASECLPRAEAVAAIDSALNGGLVALSELAELPAGRVFADRVAEADPSAQSGLETIVRLVIRDLGLQVRSQVRFPGIGIADLVVERWVVIEADGSEFHDTAVVSARDRARDARHAAAGRTPLRFRYGQVVGDLPGVAAAIIGAVRVHRRIHNSGWLTARAEVRARRLGLT